MRPNSPTAEIPLPVPIPASAPVERREAGLGAVAGGCEPEDEAAVGVGRGAICV